MSTLNWEYKKITPILRLNERKKKPIHCWRIASDNWKFIFVIKINNTYKYNYISSVEKEASVNIDRL